MSAGSDSGQPGDATGLRVLIADDHPGVRVAVRHVLQGDGFVVCAEAGDAEEAVAAAIRERPEVCLLDIRMPGSGVAAAETIVRELPSAAVVMLTVSDEDADLFSALRAGASGYLLKRMDPDRIPAALRGVLHGEAAMPRELVTRLVQQFRDRGRRRIPLPSGRTVELTEREWQTLDMLRHGLSTSAIAERLVLSPVTVRRHVSRLVRRLGVNDRDAAVRLLDDLDD